MSRAPESRWRDEICETRRAGPRWDAQPDPLPAPPLVGHTIRGTGYIALAALWVLTKACRLEEQVRKARWLGFL